MLHHYIAIAIQNYELHSTNSGGEKLLTNLMNQTALTNVLPSQTMQLNNQFDIDKNCLTNIL